MFHVRHTLSAPDEQASSLFTSKISKNEVRRQARALQSESSPPLSYMQALEVVAKRMGFESYYDLKNSHHLAGELRKQGPSDALPKTSTSRRKDAVVAYSDAPFDCKNSAAPPEITDFALDLCFFKNQPLDGKRFVVPASANAKSTTPSMQANLSYFAMISADGRLALTFRDEFWRTTAYSKLPLSLDQWAVLLRDVPELSRNAPDYSQAVVAGGLIVNPHAVKTNFEGHSLLRRFVAEEITSIHASMEARRLIELAACLEQVFPGDSRRIATPEEISWLNESRHDYDFGRLEKDREVLFRRYYSEFMNVMDPLVVHFWMMGKSVTFRSGMPGQPSRTRFTARLISDLLPWDLLLQGRREVISRTPRRDEANKRSVEDVAAYLSGAS